MFDTFTGSIPPKHNTSMYIWHISIPPGIIPICIFGIFTDSIPPKCNPVIIPPSQWIVGSCLTVEMDCIDPTLTLSDSTSSLVYDLTGNFTTEFNKTDGIVGKFLLCYTRTTDGTFQVRLIPKLHFLSL